VFAAHGFYHVEHDVGRNAIAGDFVLIDADLQDGLPRNLFGAHVGSAGDRFQNALDLGSFFHQHVEVVAIEDGGHVGANAGDHFVHPHFNWLQKRQSLPRHFAEVFVDQRGQKTDH
jgi:hypothetical protein